MRRLRQQAQRTGLLHISSLTYCRKDRLRANSSESRMKKRRICLRSGSCLLLPLFLIVMSIAAECPTQAQQSTPSKRSRRFTYIVSLLGGAAVGAAAGALVGGRDSIGKGLLVGGGATSAMYLYKDQQSPADPLSYMTSYTLLGTGLGWTFSDSGKGTGIGALAGFGGSALWLSLRQP
jgi:hypothetical protein